MAVVDVSQPRCLSSPCAIFHLVRPFLPVHRSNVAAAAGDLLASPDQQRGDDALSWTAGSAAALVWCLIDVRAHPVNVSQRE